MRLLTYYCPETVLSEQYRYRRRKEIDLRREDRI